ncbi:DUF309 domain-containing protein [Paenibacillus sp. HB172176]|uniref:DUF309 domain-containing protein n=1 Tax=Paenibacillus sp. HB172176 TaxID=2493690 RepID=UPI001439F293|nr:DUF309 domain-containing protein [Paenibacillus sp. HB172176]
MKHLPEAYLAFLIEFHGTRDYFECHELLEEYWKTLSVKDKDNIWVGLIQLAVGQYHERRGNARGAIKMYKGALSKLGEQQLASLGLDGQRLNLLLKERIRLVEAGESPFADLDLPLNDEALLASLQLKCAGKGLVWGAASEMDNAAIIHRHKLRDRSDVIEERDEALRRKSRK